MPGEPVCSAIIFCDYVIVEARTGKNSLIGSFPNIGSSRFPLVVPQMYVHTTISNFSPTGKQNTVVVNIKQKSSGAVIASAALPITVPVPKEPFTNGMHINLNVPLRNITFRSEGIYECEVLVDGEQVGTRMLEIRLKAAPPPQIPPSGGITP